MSATPWLDWREAVFELWRKGIALEDAAEELHAKGLTFDVRPHFWPARLDMCKVSGTLQDFTSAVTKVAAVLGAPRKCSAAEYSITDGDRAPDLEAEWLYTSPKLGKDVLVGVRVLMPTGCKIDPRTEYRAAEKVALHPECKAALDELAEAVGAPDAPMRGAA